MRDALLPDSQGPEPPAQTRADPALVKALARAFRRQRMLDEGRYASISEMARAERIERGYLGRILRLALLAPEIVEAVLNGTQDAELGLPRLLDGMPLIWSEQLAVTGPPVWSRSHGEADVAGP